MTLWLLFPCVFTPSLRSFSGLTPFYPFSSPLVVALFSWSASLHCLPSLPPSIASHQLLCIRYSFRLGKDQPWSTIEPSTSARQAFHLFLVANKLSSSQESKAFNLFGLQSKELQEVLSKRVAEHDFELEAPPPKRRGVVPRTTLKAVVANIGTQVLPL